MDAKDLLLLQTAAVHQSAVTGMPMPTIADRMFSGLSESQMRARPTKTMNSLAWLVWHMARAEDLFVARVLFDEPQVFHEWSHRLNVDRKDIGTGMTSEEVDELSAAIDLEATLQYRIGVGRRTRALLRAAPERIWTATVVEKDLDRAVAAGGFGPNAEWLGVLFEGRPAPAVLAAMTVSHAAMHIGEAGTIRAEMGVGLGV